MLNTGRPKFKEVTNELRLQLIDLCTEAYRGDPDARQWLLSSFPGHVAILERMWSKEPATVKQTGTGENLKKPETADIC